MAEVLRGVQVQKIMKANNCGVTDIGVLKHFAGHITIDVVFYLRYPTSWQTFSKGLRFQKIMKANNGAVTLCGIYHCQVLH